MQKSEIDKFVAADRDQKAVIHSLTTVVRGEGARLVALPCDVAYRAQLGLGAEHLRKAAMLSPDPAFAKFLRARPLRARAGS